MKNILSVIAVLMSLSLYSQGIHFEKTTYQELINKAKKENKLVFIDAYASWCGPCKMMVRNVFSQKKVGDFYNKNFINAKIDMEKGEGRKIAQNFRVFSYPTYLFINGDGVLISRNRGYIQPHNFITLGEEAQMAFKEGKGLAQQFKNGAKSPELLKKMIKLYTSSDFELAKKASERYFENKTTSFTQEDINYLIPFMKSSKDKNFVYFLNHKKEITKVLPEKDYHLVQQQIELTDAINEYTDFKKGKIKNEKKLRQEFVNLFGEQKAENQFDKFKLNLYQNTNSKKFTETALRYYEKSQNFNRKEVTQTSWIIAQNSNNKATLKKVCVWMESVIMRGEDAENTYILAKIYQKLGKKAEAKMFAKASIDLSRGKKMLLAEKLLKELEN